MKIIGIENMSPDDIRAEVQRGGKFVIYQYVLSVIAVSFKRSSPIYFVKVVDGPGSKPIGYSVISLLFGWWGIPWGLAWTITTTIANLRGGIDVTQQVMDSFGLTKAA